MPRIASTIFRPYAAALLGVLALAAPALAAQGGGGGGGNGGASQGGGPDPASVYAPAIAGRAAASHAVAAARTHAAGNRNPQRTRDPKDPPYCSGAFAEVSGRVPGRWFVCDIGL